MVWAPVEPVPENYDDREDFDVDEHSELIEWDESLRSSPQRPRPRPGHRLNIQPLSIQASNQEAGPILSITYNGSEHEYRVSLASQTSTKLTDICCKLVGYFDVKIHYWNPVFKFWTEVQASDNLQRLMIDVKDRRVVHVFVLKPWEKAADLPFMKEDSFFLGELVVPVRGRREPSIKARGEWKNPIAASTLILEKIGTTRNSTAENTTGSSDGSPLEMRIHVARNNSNP